MTLSEINITPLLDLAFVLLIIFVITRPLMENSIQLNLPKGGQETGKVNVRDVRRVEISTRGEYQLDGRAVSLPQLEAALVAAFKANPKSIVYLRADEQGFNKHTYAVFDICQRHGIERFNFATEPPK
ncbi:MAG: biopolymer transporter ExbD [Verrucomicrobia bacterium]|nr:biopolymer transporter ExbD [Verrucomicrobiota bacterium]